MRGASRCTGSLALAAILACPLSVAAADRIPIEAVVAFNTQCARCHEGECSGRLSFHLGEDAADEHIRRYSGALPLETVRHLGELLRYMKVQCAFYPLSLALASDSVWAVDTLGRLRAPDGTAYFLPLGVLAPGRYRLWIDGPDPGVRLAADVIAADFEQLAYEGIDQVGELQVLAFRVDTPAELYVRIRAQGPISLTRVALVTGESGGIDHQ
jgi:hypothetical protein